MYYLNIDYELLLLDCGINAGSAQEGVSTRLDLMRDRPEVLCSPKRFVNGAHSLTVWMIICELIVSYHIISEPKVLPKRSEAAQTTELK